MKIEVEMTKRRDGNLVKYEVNQKKIDDIELLIGWRDSVKEKRKARAIQRVITKIYNTMNKIERGRIEVISKIIKHEIIAC